MFATTPMAFVQVSANNRTIEKENYMQLQNRLVSTAICLLAFVSIAGCVIAPSHRVYREPPPPSPVRETVVVEETPNETIVTTFYDDLAPQGTWVYVEGYGRCWYPRGVGRDWRPYYYGHWAYTEYGNTWVSDEPWGPSTYHYGRWVQDRHYGWVWIPGNEWGPAWVAWRSGGGYTGWAPLGPSVRSVHITEIETRSIPSEHYVFVEERHLTEQHVHERAVNVQQNVTIINQTTNITNITRVNNVVVNNSVSTAQIERATGRPVERTKMVTATTTTEVTAHKAEGSVVQYKPKTLPPPPPQPIKAAETKAQQIKRLNEDKKKKLEQQQLQQQQQGK